MGTCCTFSAKQSTPRRTCNSQQRATQPWGRRPRTSRTVVYAAHVDVQATHAIFAFSYFTPWSSCAEDATRTPQESALEGAVVQVGPVRLATVLLAIRFETLRDVVADQAQLLPGGQRQSLNLARALEVVEVVESLGDGIAAHDDAVILVQKHPLASHNLHQPLPRRVLVSPARKQKFLTFETRAADASRRFKRTVNREAAFKEQPCTSSFIHTAPSRVSPPTPDLAFVENQSVKGRIVRDLSVKAQAVLMAHVQLELFGAADGTGVGLVRVQHRDDPGLVDRLVDKKRGGVDLALALKHGAALVQQQQVTRRYLVEGWVAARIKRFA